MQISDFIVSDGPDDFRHLLISAQKNDDRFNLKTPIYSQLHYNSFHYEEKDNTELGVYWYLPIFYYIGDISYRSVKFRINANTRVKDISESVFCYVFSRVIALNFKGYPYHFSSSGFGGENIKELSYPVFKPFIYIKRPKMVL